MSTTAWLIINEPSPLGPTDQTGRLDFSEGQKHSFNLTSLQRGTADIALRVHQGDTYKPTIGCEVFLYDQTVSGDVPVFVGTIDRVKLAWESAGGEQIFHLSCVSLESTLDTIRIPPTIAYSGQSCGFIVTDLFNKLMTAGSPLIQLGSIDPTNVSAIPSSVTFPNWPTLWSVIKQFAALSGFICGIDITTSPLPSLYFNLPNTTPSPFTLASADLEWLSMEWEQNRQDYRNRQILQINPSAFAQSSELFLSSSYGALPAYFQLLRPPSQVTFAWTTQGSQSQQTGTFTGAGTDGDTITITYPTGSSSPYTWQPNSPYQVGQIIIDPAGHTQQVTHVSSPTSNFSGPTMPSWNDTGGTTSDFELVWQDLGIQQGGVYTLKTVLDNTQWGQVLIGANAAATAQNFVDALNSMQTRAGVELAGVTFSLPTWENPLVNASVVSGGQIRVVNKPAGAYSAALASTSSSFSWLHPSTSGGGVNNTAPLSVAINGQSASANLYYTPGQTQIALASVPSNTPVLSRDVQVQYTRLGGDSIVVEDTSAVTARAVIEGGTGKYQQLKTNTGIASNVTGLAEAQQALAAYLPIPVLFTFSTFIAGLKPGQYLSIALDNSNPEGVGALVGSIGTPKSYVVQEVSADLVPIKAGLPMPGSGHYSYSVTVIDVAQIGSWLDFWQDLIGGGGGAEIVGGLSGGDLATSGGLTTTPPAIVSITAVLTYVLVGNDSGVQISGVITLPTTDPSYSLLDSIIVSAFPPGTSSTAPAGQGGIVLNGIQSITGTTVNYTLQPIYPLPTTDQPNWTVEGISQGIDGVTAAAVASSPFTVDSIKITAVTATETARYIDLTDQSTHAVITVTPTPNHAGIPYVATIWFFFRYSSGTAPAFYWVGWFPFTGTSSPIDFPLWNGPAVNFQCAIVQGSWGGDGPTALTLADITALVAPAVVELSSPFSEVIEPPIAGGISFSVTNGQGLTPTPDNIYGGINSLGNPYAAVLVNYTPPGNGDPNCWYYQSVLQWGSYDGTTFTQGDPGGVSNPSSYQLGVQCVNNGATQSWSTQGIGPGLYINYPSPNAMSSANLPIQWILFEWYGLNRNSTNGATPWDGSDPNTILQTQTFFLHVGQGYTETSNANMVANPFTPTTGSNPGLIGWNVTSNPSNVSVNSNGQLEIVDNATIQEQVPHSLKTSQSFTLEFDLACDAGKPGTFTANLLVTAVGGGTATYPLVGVAGTLPAFNTNILTATVALPKAANIRVQFVASGDASSGLNWYVENVLLVQQVKVGGPISVNTSGQLTLAVAGVTSTYLAAASVDATKLAAGAVTNAAIALNAVNGNNLNSAGISQVFTGAVVLSEGSGNPVMVLTNSGLSLFGAANGPGTAGLTNYPFVQIQNTGMLIYGGIGSSTGAATFINATGVLLSSATTGSGTPNFSQPYTSISASGTLISSGSGGSSVSITPGQLRIYSVDGDTTHPYININATTGIQITNSVGTMSLSATGFSIAVFSGANIVATGGTMSLTGNAGTVTINGTDSGIPGVSLLLRVPGPASIDTLYVRDVQTFNSPGGFIASYTGIISLSGHKFYFANGILYNYI